MRDFCYVYRDDDRTRLVFFLKINSRFTRTLSFARRCRRRPQLSLPTPRLRFETTREIWNVNSRCTETPQRFTTTHHHTSRYPFTYVKCIFCRFCSTNAFVSGVPGPLQGVGKWYDDNGNDRESYSESVREHGHRRRLLGGRRWSLISRRWSYCGFY